jgi:hypothetical protein
MSDFQVVFVGMVISVLILVTFYILGCEITKTRKIVTAKQDAIMEKLLEIKFR